MLASRSCYCIFPEDDCIWEDLARFPFNLPFPLLPLPPASFSFLFWSEQASQHFTSLKQDRQSSQDLVGWYYREMKLEHPDLDTFWHLPLFYQFLYLIRNFSRSRAVPFHWSFCTGEISQVKTRRRCNIVRILNGRKMTNGSLRILNSWGVTKLKYKNLEKNGWA